MISFFVVEASDQVVEMSSWQSWARRFSGVEHFFFILLIFCRHRPSRAKTDFLAAYIHFLFTECGIFSRARDDGLCQSKTYGGWGHTLDFFSLEIKWLLIPVLDWADIATVCLRNARPLMEPWKGWQRVLVRCPFRDAPAQRGTDQPRSHIHQAVPWSQVSVWPTI